MRSKPSTGAAPRIVSVSELAAAVGLGLAFASCEPKCDGSSCESLTAEMVKIEAGRDVPVPSTDYDVNCLDPAAADLGFCGGAGSYIGWTFMRTSGQVGAAIAKPGRVSSAPVTSSCSNSCEGRSGTGLDLTLPLKFCDVKVGADLSSRVTSAHSSEISRQVYAELPAADRVADWEMTERFAALKAYCSDPHRQSEDVITGFWTGRIEVEAGVELEHSASAELCCGKSGCLDANIGTALDEETKWQFSGVIGVKLATRSEFCAGARGWLSRHCAWTGGSAPACADLWWDVLGNDP